MNAGARPLVSVVIPVFNEERSLQKLHERLDREMRALKCAYEILYVDDGSDDSSMDIARNLAARNPAVRLIELSRNFGKEIAITAGLDHALGDAVILMDADGQDPPEEIPRMIAEWQRGHDMVCMRRRQRNGESWLKRSTAHVFYRLMRHLSKVDIPADVGDFRLLSRAAVEAMAQLPERTRFMKGLFAWVGFRHCILDFERDARDSGTSKFNYWKLWNLALDGITSFSVTPLKLAGYLGFVIASLSFVYGAFIFIKAAVFGDPVPGFPTLAVIMLFLGGTQLLAIGVIGEYLARIFVETKGRPLYILKHTRHERHAHKRVA